jgi:hypothetical protein
MHALYGPSRSEKSIKRGKSPNYTLVRLIGNPLKVLDYL